MSALRRLPVWGAWLALVLVLGALAVREARTSALQARLLSAFVERLGFVVASGPSASFAVPRHGPYDNRLGYVRIPTWTRRLTRDGFDVTEQARLSPALLRLTALGLLPPYHEKARAGLSVLGPRRAAVFSVSAARAGYADFARSRRGGARHAAVRREPRAAATRLAAPQPGRRVGPPRARRAVQLAHARRRRGAGGSTLATQIEKYRHSPGGLTSSPLEKLRQIASASLRAYRDGERHAARRGASIVLDYMNSLPLAARAGGGEVHRPRRRARGLVRRRLRAT